MRVIVGNQIYVENPHENLMDYVRKELVLDNPEYAKKVRMHKWVGNTPQKIYLYETDGDTLILPYGCLAHVLVYTDRRDSVQLKMHTPKMVWYGCDIPLYDYQKEATQAMQNAYYGILQAPAGSGKTQIGLSMAVTLGRKTLWLTHTQDLLNQSRDRALQYMDESLTGTITDGKVNIGKGITFATVQTMSKIYLPQYRDTWDVIIVDECHRVASSPTAVSMFGKVLNALAARYKYGLSATVHRADGLIKSTFALLGDVRHVVPEEAVCGRIMKVSVCPVCTHVEPTMEALDTDGTIIYAKLIKSLTECEERNQLIAEKLIDNSDRYNLILSDRLAHLERMRELLPEDLKRQSAMIDGKMTSKKAKEERRMALELMRQGKLRYLFATYALAKEGLDIPRLNRLYLTTPQKDYAVVAQSVGRVARVFEGKTDPVVYDFVDEGFQYLVRSYKKRCTTYRKLGCTFKEE